MAAVVSITVLGLALLVPIDGDMDRFDTFAATLALLLPLVLATAFEWDGERGRLVRAVCWTWRRSPRWLRSCCRGPPGSTGSVTRTPSCSRCWR